MYPSIHSNSSVGVPSLAGSNHAPRDNQSFVDSESSGRFTANGPATLARVNSSVLPVLRVRVADQLALTPPVSLSTCLCCLPVLELDNQRVWRRAASSTLPHGAPEVLDLQVMVSAQLGNIPRTEYTQSFDFEHQVLRDYPLNSQLPSAENDTDTADADVQRYMQLGHTREAVMMALIAVQGTVDRDTQVCLHFSPLQT